MRSLQEAGLAAGLFACHPIHTEAVAGIVGQAELLCASLSILAFLAYTNSRAARYAGPPFPTSALQPA